MDQSSGVKSCGSRVRGRRRVVREEGLGFGRGQTRIMMLGGGTAVSLSVMRAVC
jgi:hypothetical protein